MADDRVRGANCVDISVIISRSELPDVTTATFEEALAQQCAAAGLEVILTPSLYHLPEDSSLWATLALASKVWAVFTRLQPRAMKWLLHRHGILASQVHVLNLETFASPAETVDNLIACLQMPFRAASSSGAIRTVEEPTAPRWYPVVDYSRCTNCQSCLQFCLFGVYELGEAGQVTVAKPDNCKHGCPACARVCPVGAIMFPLYAKDPVIAGASAGQGAPAGVVTPDGPTAQSSPLDQPKAPASAVLDEIDALIKDLEDMAGRS